MAWGWHGNSKEEQEITHRLYIDHRHACKSLTFPRSAKYIQIAQNHMNKNRARVEFYMGPSYSYGLARSVDKSRFMIFFVLLCEYQALQLIWLIQKTTVCPSKIKIFVDKNDRRRRWLVAKQFNMRWLWWKCSHVTNSFPVYMRKFHIHHGHYSTFLIYQEFLARQVRQIKKMSLREGIDFGNLL